jgi:hypothetical protein
LKELILKTKRGVIREGFCRHGEGMLSSRFDEAFQRDVKFTVAGQADS